MGKAKLLLMRTLTKQESQGWIYSLALKYKQLIYARIYSYVCERDVRLVDMICEKYVFGRK